MKLASPEESPRHWDEAIVMRGGAPAAASEDLGLGGRLNQPPSLAWWPHGHGRVPTICWGSVSQGPGWPSPGGAGPEALILKGDWCGEEPILHASESGSGRSQPDRWDDQEPDTPKK